MKHIISLSGGIGSYETIKRVLNKGIAKNDIICVFCDTKNEDEDLYRFLNDIEAHLDIKIIKLVDGRNPFDLMREQNFLYNSRVANCSKILKSKLFTKWLKENYKPEECVIYFGIDFTETNRCIAISKNYLPYKVEFPLTEKPYLYKYEMLDNLEKEGIKRPYLYTLGFPHNNCKGACIKAGIGQYAMLYRKLPNVYMYMEEFEQEMQNRTGKKVTILKRKGQPYSLKELRLRLERNEQLSLFEENDFGACGCFVDDDIEF